MAPVSRRPLRLAVLFATAGVVLSAITGTLVFGPLATLLSFSPLRGRGWSWCGKWWSRYILFWSGVRLETSYEVPLPRDGRFIFLPNHQSYYDIPILLATLPSTVHFAAKQSLFKIPVFGWSLKAGGFIPIDRHDKSRAREAFNVAAARLQKGGSVLFFPEGSRSWDGRLQPFELGGFLLALKTGLPIVPVGISGAHPILPRGGRWIDPGTIRLRYGTPIDVTAYGIRRREELVQEVRARIRELSGIEDGAGGAVDGP